MVKLMVIFMLISSTVMTFGNAPDAPTVSPVGSPVGQTTDCSDLIYNMMDCLSFLSSGSNETKPDASCCSGFKSAVEANAECICYALSSSASLGLDIDMAHAAALPSACNVNNAPPITACNTSPANPPAVASPPSQPTTQPPAAAPISGAAPAPANSPTAFSVAPAPSPHSGAYAISPTFSAAFIVFVLSPVLNVLA